MRSGVGQPSPDCAHCGLPLGRRTVSATVAGEQSRFCCYGCVLAQQVTRARGEHGAAESILIRLGLAIFFAMNVMMVSMPSYVPYVYGTSAGDGPLFQVLRVLALAFAAPVIGLLGWPILVGAARGIRDGAANTDALIVLGTVAAYALSVINTFTGRGAVYFDTAAMLLVLVTLGRYLEARAKAEAGAAVRATLAPAPAVAIRVRVAAGLVLATSERQTETVSPDVLAPGDVVRVAPGDAFPTDGVVIDGTGGVDEAALTGEQRAVLKEPGSTVASGTCSIDGLFHVRVTARAAESAAARIAALLAAARRERAPAERLADRVASVLVPVVIVVALAAAAWWTLHAGFDTGVLVGLAVLVVACPCGLGIATPVAVWTGLVTAARRGVIVRSAPVFERAAQHRAGPLRQDRHAHRTHAAAGRDRAGGRQRPLAGRCPVARGGARSGSQASACCRGRCGVATGARSPSEPGRSGRSLTATEVQVVPGRGVRGVVGGESLATGSVSFAAEDLGSAVFRRYADTAGSVVLLWRPRQLLGALRFAEAPRPEAAAALDRAAPGGPAQRAGLRRSPR